MALTGSLINSQWALFKAYDSKYKAKLYLMRTVFHILFIDLFSYFKRHKICEDETPPHPNFNENTSQNNITLDVFEQ
jgi:hypothetical protein